MNIEVFGSSSKGNGYIITTQNGDESIIVECGVEYKKIMESIDFDLAKVKGVLVSHSHKDHSRSAEKLAEKGLNIYSSKETFENLGLKGHRYVGVEALKQFKLGGFSVLPFDLEHDVRNFGYLIYHKEIGKILFMTDTYYSKYKFTGINYIMIECNYSNKILDRNVEEGKLNSIVKKRVLKSHFSLNNVKDFLSANDLSRLKMIILLHLSDGNSNAEQFKNEIEKLTGIPTVVAG